MCYEWVEVPTVHSGQSQPYGPELRKRPYSQMQPKFDLAARGGSLTASVNMWCSAKSRHGYGVWYLLAVTSNRRPASTAATSSASQQASRQAQYRAGLIELYAQFIEIRTHEESGKKYRFNKALGEPKHEDRNRLGLPHGDWRAYDIAKCQCKKCLGANTKKQAQADERRVAAAKDRDVERVTTAVQAVLPSVSVEMARLAGHAVVASSTGTRRPKGQHRSRHFLLSYKPELVAMAVRLWNAEHNAAAPLTDDELVPVAQHIVASLAE